jgi:hypothetical protein
MDRNECKDLHNLEKFVLWIREKQRKEVAKIADLRQPIGNRRVERTEWAIDAMCNSRSSRSRPSLTRAKWKCRGGRICSANRSKSVLAPELIDRNSHGATAVESAVERPAAPRGSFLSGCLFEVASLFDAPQSGGPLDGRG